MEQSIPKKQINQGQYLHGGSPDVTFKRLGIPPQKVIDFSVNVSPLGPPQIVFDNWHQLSGEIKKYPTVNGDGIVDYYRERFGLDHSQVLPGNGSTESIYLVPRTLGFKKVGIITPSFHDYERACRMAGAEITELPLLPENGFAEPEFSKMRDLLEKVDALLLGNPNNPTATLISRDNLLALASDFPDKWLLVDEAFMQYLDDADHRTLMHPDLLRRNILVFHSLTKFYDLPGLRLGCVVSHPQTIDRLRTCKEPWSVNAIAEKIAQLLAGCRDYETQLRSMIAKERALFVKELGSLTGLALFPSAVNFMLAHWSASDNLDDLLRILLGNGYHVRDCRNFRQLEDNYFRFAILNPVENMRLISLISESLKETKK